MKNLEQQHAREKRQKQNHEENETEVIERQIVASEQKDRFYRREEKSVN